FLVYLFHRRLRRVGRRNLELVFAELRPAEREAILRRGFRQLGWLLAEFARFPRHTPETMEEVIVYDGYENYARAVAAGRGVLYLTAHMSAWELSSFAHSVYGHPLAYLNRPLDNPRVDSLINRYRCLWGNVAVDRRNSARPVLERLRRGGAVGILIDQNVLPEDGAVFVDFLGHPAATTTGLARFALRTGAAVVPALVFWDESLGKYRLRFDPPVELVRTGNQDTDVTAATARFNQVLADYVRRHPDQGLWVHRRWRTRPPGEPPLYSI
ncbi:MAG: lysophospholipid acyltransferase family protein, partial [Acidobacteria bacterium]|nr:lysophospholipid acyltransferase family protein [Acidobacteriota bacterium]